MKASIEDRVKVSEVPLPRGSVFRGLAANLLLDAIEGTDPAVLVGAGRATCDRSRDRPVGLPGWHLECP